VTDEEGVLGQELPGTAGLDMPFPVAGIGLLYEGYLLGREFDWLGGRLLLWPSRSGPGCSGW